MGQPIDAVTKRLTERTEGARLDKSSAIYEEEIRYCWIDEDGARMSPVHRDFGKALSWISDWPEWTARLDEREMELQLSESSSGSYTERERLRINELRRKSTLTGKPPITLRRLILRTTVEDLVEHERETVDHVMSTIGLETR